MFHAYYCWMEKFIVISSMVGGILLGIVLLLALIIFIHDVIEEY